MRNLNTMLYAINTDGKRLKPSVAAKQVEVLTGLMEKVDIQK